MPRDYSSISPSSFVIQFDSYWDGPSEEPFPPFWIETVTAVEAGFSGFTGKGQKVAKTTMFAKFSTGYTASPINETVLRDFAVQAAIDFYGWQTNGSHRNIVGVADWALDGTDLIQWTEDESGIFTIISDIDFNTYPESFQHSDCNDDCCKGLLVYIPTFTRSGSNLIIHKGRLSVEYGKLVICDDGTDTVAIC